MVNYIIAYSYNETPFSYVKHEDMTHKKGKMPEGPRSQLKELPVAKAVTS
jgi:hypothetical protein